MLMLAPNSRGLSPVGWVSGERAGSTGDIDVLPAVEQGKEMGGGSRLWPGRHRRRNARRCCTRLLHGHSALMEEKVGWS